MPGGDARFGGRQGILLVLTGIGIWLGSELTVTHAVALAKGLRISDALIGVTVVAVGTSLPELATSLACVRWKQTDMLVA